MFSITSSTIHPQMLWSMMFTMLRQLTIAVIITPVEAESLPRHLSNTHRRNSPVHQWFNTPHQFESTMFITTIMSNTLSMCITFIMFITKKKT